MVRYKVGRPVIDAWHEVRFSLYEFCERQLFVFITAQPQPCIAEGTINLLYKTAYATHTYQVLLVPAVCMIYQYLVCLYSTKNLMWCMPVVRAIEVYPTQNISFDEVLDLTADAFPFCNIGVYSCAPHQVYHARIYMHGTGISLTAVYLVHIYHAWCTFEYKRCHKSRRPRWLGRLSSCLARSISRVQLSSSAHTRRELFLHEKIISGKRESVS